MLIKNLEDKVRLAGWVSAGSLLTSVVITLIVSAYAFREIAASRKSIYVLRDNIPMEARETDIGANRPAEYRADIELFHTLFFSLTPDDHYIEHQLRKAMYLVDESGIEQYNNLRENGFFNAILSSSSVITLQTDSIVLDLAKYYFRYYGKLKIDRRSATVIRSLVTEGHLRDIPRSDNNPHGVLICDWKTLENKDLENVQKNLF